MAMRVLLVLILYISHIMILFQDSDTVVWLLGKKQMVITNRNKNVAYYKS